jgi:hypothetical protein
MVEPSFEELMAGWVQPSPDEMPKEKEKCISAFWFMVEFLAPKVQGTEGWEADMCSIPLQQTNLWHQMNSSPSWHLKTCGSSASQKRIV